jgi:putative membrane-bound dehydrogenase-like protein
MANRNAASGAGDCDIDQTPASHRRWLTGLSRFLRRSVIGVAMGSLLAGLISAVNAADPPALISPDWKIELVAAEPALVTPVSCRFDKAGRLLVVESHTHFPPTDYAGPKTDRIFLFDDPDGDGRLDRQRLFYEGGRATMGLEVLADGSVVVATRDSVVRLRDSDGDDRVDQTEVLLRLETTANYPHNGLGGLALGPDGYLYVGQGENLGEPYRLIGTDGTSQSGAGEGGNVFRCLPDGTQLERFATGFWNPFGLHFDPEGRLWAVCNDPDARPPCRLMHVVPHSDFGFQFRFGRAGTHPLLGWNGEQPGTLPMAAGTGEAPCAVVSHGGGLWVSAWGDNRIERYSLTPRGASWEGHMEVIAQGNADFRPVDFAVAKDGSLYFTDWVDRSYPVHGRGRLWRLVPKTPDAIAGALPSLSPAELHARALEAGTLADADSLLAAALESTDPYLRQAAVSGLLRGDLKSHSDRERDPLPGRRIGLLSAWRWLELTQPERVPKELRARWISQSLEHPDSEVVRAAIRWAAESGDAAFLPLVRQTLAREDLPDNLFASAVAAIAYLETGSASRSRRDPAREKLLASFAADPDQPARLRALAILGLPAEAESPTNEQLAQWLGGAPDPQLAHEAVRLLIARDSDSAAVVLARLAQQETLDPEVRADAIAGLARRSAAHAALLQRASLPGSDEIVRREARRVLRREPDESGTLRPREDDIDGWMKLVGTGGDARAGWRVFSRTTCAQCHAYQGRGSVVGPDLTALAGQADRRRLLESILLPNKEVGPLFVAWQVLTEDGRTLAGLKLNDGSGTHTKFIGADGEVFEVAMDQIVSQRPSNQSVMPQKLQETMSVAELRDLLAMLSGQP